MSINPPGGVSWLWALIYIAIGAYVVPMILGLITSRSRKSAKDGA